MLLRVSIRRLFPLVLMLVSTAGYASVLSDFLGINFNGQEVGAPSFPLFLDTGETVKVTAQGSGANRYWTVTGQGSATTFWGDLTNSVALGQDKVVYQANFNAAGQLITSIGSTTLTNYLEISGALPAGSFGGTSWTAQPNELLLSANLLAADPSGLIATLPFSLGFKTEFTGGWAAENAGLTGGSTGENLWLVGLSLGFQKLVWALDGNNRNGTLSSLFRGSQTINGVLSVASVPLPNSAWLFGLALVAVFVVGRDKKGSLSRDAIAMAA